MIIELFFYVLFVAEPGYAFTSASALESAFTILQQLEQPVSKIPR